MLTKQELHKPWMKLYAVSALCPADIPVKWIRNWTDRGLINLAEPNPGIRKARLYSLANAIQITCLAHLTACGNTLSFSKRIADLALSRVQDLIEDKCNWQYLVDYPEEAEFFIYSVGPNGKIQGVFRKPDKIFGIVTGQNPITGLIGLEKRTFPLDEMLGWVVTRYLNSKEKGEIDRLNDQQR